MRIRPRQPNGSGRPAWRGRCPLVTLAWLAVESTLGLAAGLSAHSVALIGWGLAALVEARRA